MNVNNNKKDFHGNDSTSCFLTNKYLIDSLKFFSRKMHTKGSLMGPTVRNILVMPAAKTTCL